MDLNLTNRTTTSLENLAISGELENADVPMSWSTICDV